MMWSFLYDFETDIVVPTILICFLIVTIIVVIYLLGPFKKKKQEHRTRRKVLLNLSIVSVLIVAGGIDAFLYYYLADPLNFFPHKSYSVYTGNSIYDYFKKLNTRNILDVVSPESDRVYYETFAMIFDCDSYGAIRNMDTYGFYVPSSEDNLSACFGFLNDEVYSSYYITSSSKNPDYTVFKFKKAWKYTPEQKSLDYYLIYDFETISDFLQSFDMNILLRDYQDRYQVSIDDSYDIGFIFGDTTTPFNSYFNTNGISVPGDSPVLEVHEDNVIVHDKKYTFPNDTNIITVCLSPYELSGESKVYSGPAIYRLNLD